MRGKRWLIRVSMAAVLLLVAKYLLLDTAASPAAPYAIDVAALHAAASAGGALPTRIEVEHVADFAFPRSMVVPMTSSARSLASPSAPSRPIATPELLPEINDPGD
jgi:hypothetical protein